MKRPDSPRPAPGSEVARDRRIVARVADWFERNARDLPWRHAHASGRRDPYASLVSEFMLQQTQVARVLPRFERFLARFPTVAALAAAPIDDVLAEWSGLGYYRRARNLHAAACMIASRFSGEVPSDVESLLSLPGVGRYTAGSIASIAFGIPAPILDGNVRRVLMRLHARRSDQTSPATQSWAWARADALSALAGPRVAALNEGLMELGALVCTPDAPRCDQCPVAGLCETRRLSLQDRIPRPKRAAPVRHLVHTVVLARDLAGRVLIEQRPDTGLWAGLWQAPTIETSRSGLASLNRWLRSPPASASFGGPLQRLTTFQRTLSHRRVDHCVWSVGTPLGRMAAAECRTASLTPGGAPPPRPRVWKSPDEISRLALSAPQRHILLTLAPEAFTG